MLGDRVHQSLNDIVIVILMRDKRFNKQIARMKSLCWSHAAAVLIYFYFLVQCDCE